MGGKVIQTAVPLVADSMVFLHFGFVGKFPEFLSWFDPLLATTPAVVKEVKRNTNKNAAFGVIDLEESCRNGLLTLRGLSSSDETTLYHGYFNQRFGKKIFGPGEASCLAASLANHWGLICEEKEVLEEFKSEKTKMGFNAPAYTPRQVINLAANKGIITESDAISIKTGFLFE